MSYCSIPYGVCGDAFLPAIPAKQDCMTYKQNASQISGVLVVPISAAQPSPWGSANGWAGIVDNAVAGNIGKYIVGIGSYLQSSQTEISLGDGRFRAIQERVYKLTFKQLWINPEHLSLFKALESGRRDFNVWLETIDGRLIGGECGIQPVFVTATMPFNEDVNERENIVIEMDFMLNHFPEMTAPGTVRDNNGNTVSDSWGQVGQYVWGGDGDIWGADGQGWQA